jgi:response regulator RpfG family c-di-GMP phosphodiesterase
MKEKKINLLYVDDEPNNLVSFRANYRTYYNVFTAISAEEGMKILRDNRIHVLITDQRMPQVTGVEFLEQVIREFPDVMRLIFTGYADIQAAVDAINKGQVYRYLNKPSTQDEIRNAIETAYEVFYLREENKKLMDTLLTINQQLDFMLRQRVLSSDTQEPEDF